MVIGLYRVGCYSYASFIRCDGSYGTVIGYSVVGVVHLVFDATLLPLACWKKFLSTWPAIYATDISSSSVGRAWRLWTWPTSYSTSRSAFQRVSYSTSSTGNMVIWFVRRSIPVYIVSTNGWWNPQNTDLCIQVPIWDKTWGILREVIDLIETSTSKLEYF